MRTLLPVFSVLGRHWVLVALLSGTFLVRLRLAARQSYWLDELLSVAQFGVWQPSFSAVAPSLAAESIHPPLYQWVLYAWMQMFGESETATRTLSNLLVSGATLLVFLSLRIAWSRSIAGLGAGIFGASGMVMQYGLEARSYAQTAFLVALSSYALLRLVSLRISDGPPPIGDRATTQRLLMVLCAANTGLLLTHYYNIFWVAAQAIVMLAILRGFDGRLGLRRLLRLLSVTHMIPAAVFTGVWGHVLARQIVSESSRFEMEGNLPSRGILDVVATVSRSSIGPGDAAFLSLSVAVVLATLVALRWAHSQKTCRRNQSAVHLYLAGMFVGPVLVMSLGFVLIGAERYSTRYFLSSAVALLPLVASSVLTLTTLTTRRSRRFGSESVGAAVLLGVLVVWVVPTGLAGANSPKSDWRGIAQEVSNLSVGASGGVLVFETSWSPRSLSRFYFDQFDSPVAPSLTITRAEEAESAKRSASSASGDAFRFVELVSQEGPEAVVVLFPHQRVEDFPNAMSVLGQLFEDSTLAIDDTGRGYVVFERPARAHQ